MIPGAFAMKVIPQKGSWFEIEIEKKGVIHAVLQIDRSVHQVVKGQHVGPNDGLITGITDDAVSIREIVQDATGDWVARMSKLELQESKENSK